MANRGAELRGMRGRFQKVYETDEQGTNVALIGSEPLHYETPDGLWDDMANIVKETADGFAAHTASTRVAVEAGWLTFTHSGRTLRLRPSSIVMLDRTAPATRYRKLADAVYSNNYREPDGTIVVSDIFPQTDLRLTMTEGVISKAFTVRQRPNIPDPVSLGWNPDQTYIIIVWEVDKPAGAVVKDAETGELFVNGYVGKNALRLETIQGEPVAYFDAGTAVSANGRSGPVWYVCLGANVPFGEAMAYSRYQNAPYPIVIDPTTRITTTSSDRARAGYDVTAFYWSTVMTPIGAGNDYWYNPDPKAGGEGGGEYGAFLRWNLVPLSGVTVQSAKVRNFVKANTPTYWQELDGDWAGQTTEPWFTQHLAYSIPSQPDGYRIMTAARKPGTDTWLAVALRHDTDIGTYYGALLKTTDNFQTVTVLSPPHQVDPYAGQVYYLNGYFFVATGNSALLRTANDGSSWHVSLNATYSVRGLEYANGTYVAWGNGNGTAGYIWTSTDSGGSGATWTNRNAGFTGVGSILDATFDGTNFWITRSGTSPRYSSDNGVTWQQGPSQTMYGAYGLQSLASDGAGRVVASGTDSFNVKTIWTCDSPVGEWTVRSTSLCGRLFFAGSSTFGIGGNYNLNLSTDNGNNWSANVSDSFPYPAVTAFNQAVRPLIWDGSNWWFFPGHHTYEVQKRGDRTNLATLVEAIAHNGGASIPVARIQSKLGSYYPLRVKAYWPNSAGNEELAFTTSTGSNSTATYLEVTYTQATPTWVSPADASATQDTTPELVFTSQVSATALHFNLQLDTSNTFNTGNLRNIRSITDQTGWEYWDGAAWQALPSTGMPANKTGNQVRYTPSALALGNWYRRVRQG